MCFRLPSAARPSAANVSGSWPTPQVSRGKTQVDPKSGVEYFKTEGAAANWATPTVDDANNVTRASGSVSSLTRDTYQWATPQAHDAQGKGDPSRVGRFGTEHGGRNLNDDAASWATPRAEDGERGQGSQFNGLAEDARAWATPSAQDTQGPNGGQVSSLKSDVRAWATPTEQDSSNTAGPSQFERNSDPLNVECVKFHAGRTPSRAEAPTAPSGSSPEAPSNASASKKPKGKGLNPRFALWLMGFPTNWFEGVAPSGLSRKRSRGASPSSARSGTP